MSFLPRPTSYGPVHLLGMSIIDDFARTIAHPGLIRASTLLGPAIALPTAGGIQVFSSFVIPVIQGASVKANPQVALHLLRGTFSWGSHVFPQLATASTILFAYLAIVLPEKRLGYIAAALSSIAIAPFTTQIMMPLANGRLIELNEVVKGDPTGGKESKHELEVLLVRFRKLNLFRSGSVLVSGLIGLYLATK